MITKQQQEMLLDAPEWATHIMSQDGFESEYAIYSAGCYYDNKNHSHFSPKGSAFMPSWNATGLADLRKKQGKTVWDAVNALEGDISNAGHREEDDNLIYNTVKNKYVTIYGIEKLRSSRFVCTIEEFNQCVKEMAEAEWLNPGFPCDYELHTKNFKTIKPRMKVEYVKVNPNKEGGTYWECARDFAELDVNSLVARTNPDECSVMSWMNIKDNDELLRTYKKGKVYRKIETEITWQDEALAFFSEYKTIDMCVYINFVNSNGNTAMQSSFIKMCHLVSSMNK